jgi:hypothetical protein
LYGQQTASGAEDAPKAATYATFYPTGSAADTVYIQAMAINPAGAITGYYGDTNSVSHGFLRTPNGTITPLDVPGADNTSYPGGTFANGINPAGVITGYYVNELNVGGIAHGFLRAPNGAFTTFDCPSSQSPNFPNASPSAINPAGAITGTYFDETFGVNRGFLRTPGGTFTPFDPPTGAIYTVGPYAINPASTITGIYESADFLFHGFLRTPGGTIIPFDPPGSIYTQPYGINPAGAITGTYSDGSPVHGPHGFLRVPNGTVITIDYPGSYQTSPSGITPVGTITGSYVDAASFMYHGFRRTPNGTFTTFDVPVPGSTTYPLAINPAGVIAGYYTDAGGIQRGFVRIPAHPDE